MRRTTPSPRVRSPPSSPHRRRPSRSTSRSAGPYTVWLDDGGVIDSGARDNIVAAANCVATFADGTSSTFRGAIQGSSVQVGNMATVGTFDAPIGAAEVACHSERFGPRSDRYQLQKERTFYVTPGSPGGGGCRGSACSPASRRCSSAAWRSSAAGPEGSGRESDGPEGPSLRTNCESIERANSPSPRSGTRRSGS